MSKKLTEILGPDGETIYIQYDDEETDELRAVSSMKKDIQERTEMLKTKMVRTVRGYSQLVMDAVKQVMNHPTPSKECDM